MQMRKLFPEEVKEALEKDGVKILPYNDIYSWCTGMKEGVEKCSFVAKK